MITEQLINPRSIVVVGGSDDVQKPGGKVLKNLKDHNFSGNLYVVNPKLDEVQGIKSYRDVANCHRWIWPYGHCSQILPPNC